MNVKWHHCAFAMMLDGLVDVIIEDLFHGAWVWRLAIGSSSGVSHCNAPIGCVKVIAWDKLAQVKAIKWVFWCLWWGRGNGRCWWWLGPVSAGAHGI